MLETVLALIPKVGSAVAALPEFVKLIGEIGKTLHEDDQATLKRALALAIVDSDEANAELAALVEARK